MLRPALVLFALLLLLPLAASAPPPVKIVLIAGPKDAAHPPGTHEYEQSVRLLADCLNQSAKELNLTVETHFNGWPKDDGTLKDAATVVLIASGSDRKAEDHPLLVGDRLAVLAKEMKRGCGLVTLHWATFFPREKANATLLEWTGGHFDYESGQPPQRWSSAIQTLTTTLHPADPESPITRGVGPFKIHDELYYRMRLKRDEPKHRPVLQAEMPGERGPQTVAWSLERAGGGRGFAFTGGHFFKNWEDDRFRRVVLNAIVWTAGAEVPAGGIRSTLPPSPPRGEGRGEGPPRAEAPVVSPDWTPRPATGKSEPWEKFTDKDWVDDRLRQMNTGPFFNGTFRFKYGSKEQVVNKGTAVKLDHRSSFSALFDRNQLRLAAVWQNGFLSHTDKRFGLLNTPSPAGEQLWSMALGMEWANPQGTWENPHPATAPLPATWGEYLGLRLVGERVVFRYRIGDLALEDSPSVVHHNDGAAFVRFLRLGPSKTEHKLLLSDRFGTHSFDIEENRVAYLRHDSADLTLEVVGDGCKLLIGKKDNVLSFPPSEKPRSFALIYTRFGLRLKRDAVKTWEPDAFAPTAKAGPRWGPPLVTQGVRAPDDAAYVIDTLTIPYANHHKALFFVGGLDFMPDGRIACCTAHGDVWLVRFADDLKRVEWKRFATGLYQPLGLKVVDGKVVVLERGQLTRLVDTNGDDEADDYDCLCGAWDTGAGEHSYDSCLETDPQGNFHFFKTGDTHLPTGGCLLRVDKDGKKAEVFATGFRHPVGLGCGPTGILTGADQEGNWMPATRIDEYRRGGFYGDFRAHHRPTPPTTFDPPLCWLPREVDNSAGGQCWIPEGTFGPLGGSLLHFSFGRCKALLLLRQAGNGLSQGGAYDLELKFLSGAMRGRFNPKDGCLYVGGMTGWQTGAIEDGCLQRVRYTGKPITLPTKLAVTKAGIDLTFNEPLDPASVRPESFDLEQWNYRWSGDYGSKHWSVKQPTVEGHDPVPVAGVELRDGGRTVRLKVTDLKPVMQMKLRFDLKTKDGKPQPGVLHHTINFVE